MMKPPLLLPDETPKGKNYEVLSKFRFTFSSGAGSHSSSMSLKELEERIDSLAQTFPDGHVIINRNVTWRAMLKPEMFNYLLDLVKKLDELSEEKP